MSSINYKSLPQNEADLEANTAVPVISIKKKIVYTIGSLILFSLLYLAYIPLLMNTTTVDGTTLLKACKYIEVPSDGVTALCYFLIPFIMVYIYWKRRDIPFNGLFIMFVCFIICCGCTHLVGMLYTWLPAFSVYLSTTAKFLTAVVSFSTACALFRSIPSALTFPSRQLLEKEIMERKDAQRKIQELYDREVVTAAIIDKIRLPYKVKDVLAVAAAQVQEAFHVDRCTIHLLDEDTLDCSAEHPPSRHTPAQLKDTSTFLQYVLSSPKAAPVNLRETTCDPLLQLFYNEWGISSALCVRASDLDKCQGIIVLHSSQPRIFTEQEFLMLETIAAQVSIGLGQAHILEVTENARAMIEEANNAKSEFLAVVSHELRTPLNAIMGMLVILGDSSLTSEQMECYKIMQESSNSLLRLLNTLLDFTKLEAEKCELESGKINLRKVMEKCISIQAHKISQKPGLTTEIIVDPALPMNIIGDKLRIKQILVNLICNAVKFTEKGTVSLRAFLHSKCEDTLILRFEVQDTGIGIAEDLVHKLFQPFSQVDSSMTRKYGGTGLGLAICKKLSNLMGGDIWVESKQGVGSTFFVTLSVKAAKDQTVKRDPENIPLPTSKCQGTCSIMIVEDNEVNLKVATQLLLRDSFRNIVAVTDGQKAVDYLRYSKEKGDLIDIILMDLHMPVMDGVTATKLIRKEIGSAQHPYIIALTADVQCGIKQTCIDAGMNDFLSKPFRPKELREVMERARIALKIL